MPSARMLLREIKGENGNGHTGIKGLWPKLARYGFSETRPPEKGSYFILPPANFPKSIEKALSSTTPRLKPRKRPKRGSYAESSVPAPAPAPRRVTPVAPSGNCPICYEKLSRDATVFECSHAMCASCSDSFATAEVARSMSRRSGVSVACPLCRAPSKVVLPEEMHTSLPL